MRVVTLQCDMLSRQFFFFFFFFQAEDGIRDYKVTGVQTCALPICEPCARRFSSRHSSSHASPRGSHTRGRIPSSAACVRRSEEHTSELQSPCNLVCRLLLEKKKKKTTQPDRQTNNSRSRPIHTLSR